MTVLVGRPVNFTAPTVLGNTSKLLITILFLKLPKASMLLWFYPLDFTFVCPSGLIAGSSC